jgi:Family of unknown function (DUF6064)
MQEWWSYRPGDFLLFSPRTYWRLFQLANEALWPLQIPVLLIGAAILAMLSRPRAWADRVIPAVLAAAWLSVSVGFLWMHYAAINWAAIYFVPVFVGEGLLVLWLGTVRGRPRLRCRARRGGGDRDRALCLCSGVAPADPARRGTTATSGGSCWHRARSNRHRNARSPNACSPPHPGSAAHSPADHLVPRKRTHPADDGRSGGLDPVDGGGAGCLGAGLAPPERDMLQLGCCTR